MKKQVKYDPKFCEELLEHCKQGFTIEQFAAKIGCSRASIYNWIEKYEDFATAHEDGKAHLEMRIIKRLHDFADGNMPRTANVIAAIYLAKNLGIRDDVTKDNKDDNTITVVYGELKNPDA